ncbi:MAG: phosphate transport system permease protein [Sphingobacteriales bacterium]
MKYSVRRIKELIIKSIMTLSGAVSSITVILIIIFLFKEGFGLINGSPVEEGYTVFVSELNPVKELSANDLKDIYEGDKTNWDEFGGDEGTIQILELNVLTDIYPEDTFGESLENLPMLIQSYVSEHPHVLGVFPSKYIPTDIAQIKISNISLMDFLGGKYWYPTAKPAGIFGILPIILGTLWVTLGSIIFALPIGIASAIYLAEVAKPNMLRFLKPTIELLAGIPSVVFGFFGLVVIVPMIQKVFFLSVGETALAGSILLGIIALPTIITLSEDAIRSVPKSMKMGSLALGATRWQTITRVSLPYAMSGVTSACILGVGRAIGETMAVLMVTGNAARIPTTFLQPVRTIPATIAAELGEAPIGGTHYKSLFVLGCILFIITFVINLVVELITSKQQLKKN